MRPSRRRLQPDAGCLRCGICCDLYGHRLRATDGDLERWNREGRADLLARVGPDQEIWYDPATGERLDDCPFLVRTGPEEARCRIHYTKPAVCRRYPTRAHRGRCVRGRVVSEGDG
ncbi:MAG: YkgJ family cysteine cluster protein [Candidatus Dadabacteria bacterium]|nr:MAG: YkgJ family cysteine cluster protein [Candidatus Dadabacteria bacterium]